MTRDVESLKWIWKPFSELTVAELYEAIKLRERVFIVEQNCVYLDCDGNDPKAWHLIALQGDGSVVATLRAFPAGVKYPESSIGRVVSAPELRGTGLGKELTKRALGHMADTFGVGPIRISAQAYLEKFYSGFGFVRQGSEYLEDNIPHVEMLRS